MYKTILLFSIATALFHHACFSADTVDKCASPSLQIAVTNSDSALVTMLLEKGANFREEDKTRTTPWQTALLCDESADRRVVRKFFEREAFGKEDALEAIYFILAKAPHHIPLLNFLLTKNVDVNAAHVRGRRPIDWAARFGHVDAIKLLLDAGSTMTRDDDWEGSPLHLATKHGHVHAVETLLSLGASSLVLNCYNHSPLHVAITNNDYALVDLLATHDAINFPQLGLPPFKDVSEIAFAQFVFSPLQHAVDLKRQKLIPLLLQRGAEPNAPTKYDTAIDIAVKSNQRDVARMLLEHEVDPRDRRERASRQLLHAKSDEMLNLLMSYGAHIDTKNTAGRTRLHEAIGDAKMLASLLRHNADVNVQDNELNTPLHLAAKEKDVESYKLLVEAGARNDMLNSDGQFPFLCAFNEPNSKQSKLFYDYFFENEFPANFIDEKEALLYNAVNEGADYLVKKLLPAFATVDGKNEFGERVPHLAICSIPDSNDGALKDLLDKTRDLSIRDSYGNTLLHKAIKQRRSVEVLDYLLERGAEMEARNNRGETPLLLAASGIEEATVNFLFARGANILAKDNYGNTILHVFSTQSNPHFTSLRRMAQFAQSIQAGVNINAVNQDGKTCLQLTENASYRNFLESVGAR